jgi:hypothetical protein
MIITGGVPTQNDAAPYKPTPDAGGPKPLSGGVCGEHEPGGKG